MTRSHSSGDKQIAAYLLNIATMRLMKSGEWASHLLKFALLRISDEGGRILIEAGLAAVAAEVVGLALVEALPHGVFHRSDFIAGNRTEWN